MNRFGIKVFSLALIGGGLAIPFTVYGQVPPWLYQYCATHHSYRAQQICRSYYQGGGNYYYQGRPYYYPYSQGYYHPYYNYNYHYNRYYNYQYPSNPWHSNYYYGQHPSNYYMGQPGRSSFYGTPYRVPGGGHPGGLGGMHFHGHR